MLICARGYAVRRCSTVSGPSIPLSASGEVSEKKEKMGSQRFCEMVFFGAMLGNGEETEKEARAQGGTRHRVYLIASP